MNQNQPINPFAAAPRRRRCGVVAKVSADDVRAARNDWDAGRAEAFLHHNADVIGYAMLLAGTRTIASLLEQTHAN